MVILIRDVVEYHVVSVDVLIQSDITVVRYRC